MKNLIYGLDIGSFKVCATCGTVDNEGKIDILASYAVPTQGIRAGRIINSQKAAACIKEACNGLTKASGRKVRRVYVSVDSPDLRAKACTSRASFNQDTKITRIHIENLVNSCIAKNVSLDRKVIYVGLRDFTLDNRSSGIRPEGLIGRELKVSAVIISALIPTVKYFIKCLKIAGLKLEYMVPSGYAQAQGLFRNRKQDIKKDDIVIDIGSSLTKITFFKNGLVEDIAILSFGAERITEDIAAKLKLSFDCAEQLKTRYGRVCNDSMDSDRNVIVRDKLSSRIIQLERLYEIINLKTDRMLQEIKKTLLALNCDDREVTEIIFTGGGSILEGFLERAEKVLAKRVKLGFLSAVKKNHIQTQSALYATSVGLIDFGFKSRTNRNSYAKRRLNHFFNIVNRAKSLYQEYF